MDQRTSPPPGLFEYRFTVPPSAVDRNGHANNVEYVRWMQDVAVQHAAAASAAWQCLCERGLGPERHNVTIQNTFILGPAARNDPRVAPVWVLSKADTPPADQPCRLTFSAPLRLLRNGHLIEQPSLADIVIAGARRIGLFLPVPAQKHWNALGRQLLELAKDTPAGIFEGDRRDFYRYSGRQKRELGMRGVSGALLLPNGPGELAGLLGALEWLHIGKGAVFGLGQPTLESFPAPPPKTAEPI